MHIARNSLDSTPANPGKLPLPLLSYSYPLVLQGQPFEVFSLMLPPCSWVRGLYKRASEGKVNLTNDRNQAGTSPLPSLLIRAGNRDAIDWKYSWRLKAVAFAVELSGSPQGEGMFGGGMCVHAEVQTFTWAQPQLANPNLGFAVRMAAHAQTRAQYTSLRYLAHQVSHQVAASHIIYAPGLIF